MPGMSGLETVERMKETSASIKFIMVTAYEMFDYARTAIRLGVDDYILKPSKASDIIAIVGKVVNEMMRERDEQQSRKAAEEQLQKLMPALEADVVTQLLFDHVHEIHLEDLIAMLGRERSHEAFAMLVRIADAPYSQQFYRALRERIRELGAGWVGALSGGQIPLIIFREPGRTYRAQASIMVQQLFRLQNREPGTVCFIGIGSCYPELNEIRLSHQEALIATADSSLPSKFRFYEDLSAIIDLKEDYPNKQLEQQFIDYIRVGRWPEVQSMMMDYIGRYEKLGFDLVQASQRVLESLWVIYRVLSEMGIESEKSYFSFQMHDYRQLRAETTIALERLLRSVEHYHNQVEPDVVHRIKQYIIEHSASDISLERIAEVVHLSPYYISKMFKEEVGVNYIDFLTNCRMEKAKQLLANHALSLKEITYEIGYNDPNYFSKVFKKMVGAAPSDYRKQLFNSRA